MTLIAFALFGALMAAGLVSAWWSGRSATALLVASLVRALLTVAVGATLCAWQVRSAFAGIAATGSGGIGTITPSLALAMTTLRVSVIAATAVLAIGLVLSWVSRSREATATSPAWITITLVLVAAGAVGAGFVAVGAELSAARTAAHLGRWIPASPPPQYAFATQESGQQLAAESEVIEQTIRGGAVLVPMLTVLLLMMSRRDRFAAGAFAGGLARAAVILALAVSTWYVVHLGPMTSWVHALAKQVA